jgi:predicted dehydrogenase
MQFHGSDGTLLLDQSGVHVNPEKHTLNRKQVDRTPTMEMLGFEEVYAEHVRNFLDCVKSRQRPVTDIEIGHRASTACHLANIAYRTKSRLAWDVGSEKLLQGGSEAQKLLAVEYRAPWKLVV